MHRSRRIAALTLACVAVSGCARLRQGTEEATAGRTVLASHSEPAESEDEASEFPWAAGDVPGARSMPDVFDVAGSVPIDDVSKGVRADSESENPFVPSSEPEPQRVATPVVVDGAGYSELPNGTTGPEAFRSGQPRIGGRIRVASDDSRGAFSGVVDEPLAPLPRQLRVPVAGDDGPQVDITSHDDRISLVVRDAPVGTVLALIAQQQGLNVISSQTIDTTVSVTLQDVRLDHALSTLLSVAGYTWVRRDDIIVVTPVDAATKLAPQLQGRIVRVFPLDFVAAADVEKVVQGLVSKVGTVQIVESNSIDRRRTQESIIVEDLPQYVERIAEYVRSIDVPPRQVLIEAYILQVELSDELRHGVNFQYLTEIAGSDVSISQLGFANPLAIPAFFLSVDGNDLNFLLEALKTTNEVKTLASPKVLAVNGQDARIQIGERLGYFVTTTTETSTLQNVDFLDLGVVLTVTPTIGADNRILMTVRPQVSSGQINPQTGLPEEDTTEVESTVMLDDGQAMIIGGLIQEEDFETQQKVPLVGDLWYVGRLFQRRNMRRRRTEVIVCLVPRIVPLCGPAAARELLQVERATSPVVTPDLRRARRDWEPLLPDATRNPRRLEFSRVPRAIPNLRDPVPHPPEYYFPRAFGPPFETSLPLDE